ncbi:hypothetical protein LshimejAT787_0800070 [Lyophyllum shimeji]|uniref:Uncharacterized protein n=1 Tax=Lyophyllum shimeji TaxID=47721 RepID=A0A9P3URE2_LYOSH|nr:hypothetical protein LshimejAT787_0800070 [Lyophyllum shimeji]
MPPKPITIMRPHDPPKATFLENQAQMTPAKLDLVWDNWLSQAEVASPSPYSGTVHSPSNCSLASSLYENSAPQAPWKSSKKPASGQGRRWGIFASKKAVQDHSATTSTPAANEDSRRTVIHKKSKLLKKKTNTTKSTPDLKDLALGPDQLAEVNAYYAPLPDLRSAHVPAVPQTPRTPIAVITPALSPSTLSRRPTPVHELVAESVDSAVYFTVDPAWDTSKGNIADVYLLPFPATATRASGTDLKHPVEAAYNPVITQSSSTPRAAARVAAGDNETSFLFLE